MLRIFTDGACRGNPGHSAIAFIILNEKNQVYKEHSEYAGVGTNNQAEYNALISALKTAKEFGIDIQCYSDSNLLVNQMNGQWRIKHPNMKPLWRKAVELKTKFRKVSFTHVPRTNTYIQRVDELANITLDKIAQTNDEPVENSNHQQSSIVNKNFIDISNKQKIFTGRESRTYPGYQSGSEYQRQRSQTDAMVNGFLKWNTYEKVGETENLNVEINIREKTVLLKEKNKIKLSMNPNEAEIVMRQLAKGIRMLNEK